MAEIDRDIEELKSAFMGIGPKISGQVPVPETTNAMALKPSIENKLPQAGAESIGQNVDPDIEELRAAFSGIGRPQSGIPEPEPIREPVSAPRWGVLPPLAAKEPAIAPERGFISETAAAVGRGVAGAGELVGRVGRVLSPFESAMEPTGLMSRGVEKTKEIGASEFLRPSEKASGKDFLTTSWSQGLESMGPSITAMGIGAGIGAAAGSFSGPGAVVTSGAGALAGWIVGGVGGGVAFGTAEYDRFMEEGREQGKTRAEIMPHAIMSGLVEGVFETAANLLALKLFKGLGLGDTLTKPLKEKIKNITKIPLMAAAKGVAKQMPIEIATEEIQNVGENYLRKLAGLRSEDPWEVAKDTVGPTMVMTMLFGLGAHGYGRVRSMQMNSALANANADEETRLDALNTIREGIVASAEEYGEIKDGKFIGKDLESYMQTMVLASQWNEAAIGAIAAKKPINIDLTVSQFGGQTALENIIQPTPGKVGIPGKIDIFKPPVIDPMELTPNSPYLEEPTEEQIKNFMGYAEGPLEANKLRVRQAGMRPGDAPELLKMEQGTLALITGGRVLRFALEEDNRIAPISLTDEAGTTQIIKITPPEMEQLALNLLPDAMPDRFPKKQSREKRGILIDRVEDLLPKEIPVKSKQTILKKPGAAAPPEEISSLGSPAAVPGAPLIGSPVEYTDKSGKLIKGIVAEINEDGSVLVGLPNGGMVEKPATEGFGKIVEPLTRQVKHTEEEAPTVSPEYMSSSADAGTEKTFMRNYSSYYRPGWFAKRSYWLAPGQKVEPRFEGRKIAKAMGLNIFEEKTATPEQLEAFNKKRTELTQKFRKEFGEDFGNLPQQAQEIDYAAARDLGYDGLNQGDHVGVFKEVPRKVEAHGRAVPIEVREVEGGRRNIDGDYTYNNKSPADMSGMEAKAWGDAHGVENVGPGSPKEYVGGYPLPRGFGEKGKEKLTLWDLFEIKRDPPDLKRMFANDQQATIKYYEKIMRSITPKAGNPLDTLYRIIIGLFSANTQLFASEITIRRLNLSTVQDVIKLSRMLPKNPTKEQRSRVNKELRKKLGLQAIDYKDRAYVSDLGVGENADLSNLSGLAKLWLKDPSWFDKKSNETWGTYIDRLSSQVRGLGSKTASFGAALTNPLEAAVGAVDIHMGRLLGNRILENPKMLEQLGGKIVAIYNERLKTARTISRRASLLAANMPTDPKKLERRSMHMREADNSLAQLPDPEMNIAETLDDVLRYSDDPKGTKRDVIRGYVNQVVSRSMQSKIDKKGVPKSLEGVEFIETPEQFKVFSDAYIAATEAISEIARGWGIKEFPAQWIAWDLARGRMEPHEIAFPNFNRLPKLSKRQSDDAIARNKVMGFAMEKGVNLKEGGSMIHTNPFEMLYKGGPPEPVTGSRVLHEDVVGWLQKFSNWINPLLATFIAVRSQEELKAMVEQYGGELKPNTKFYGYTILPGKQEGPALIIVVSDAIVSRKAMEDTVWHELSGHVAMEALFDSRPEFNVFMDKVYTYFTMKSPKELSNTAQIYRADVNTVQGRRLAAKETLANYSEHNPQQGIVKEFVALIRRLLRTIGFTNMDLSESEVISALMRSRSIATSGTSDLASPLTFKAYTKGGTVYDIVESDTYAGATLNLGTENLDKTQLVIRDRAGNDIGRLLITKRRFGIDIDKIDTENRFKGKGIEASAIFSAVNKYGPIQEILEPTKEGKAIIDAVTREHPEFYRDNSVRMADARTAEGPVTGFPIKGLGKVVQVPGLTLEYDKFGVRKNADSVEIVAKVEGKRIGVVEFDISRGKGVTPSIKITDIKVQEEHRRKGIAERLIREIQSKHPEVPIYTNFQTELGVPFFKKMGIGRTVEAYLGGVPNIEGLTFNGVQEIPGEPDQYVFTEEKTGSTFYSKSLKPEFLKMERDRVRKKFKEPEPSEGFGKIVMPDMENSLPGATPDHTSEVKNMSGYQLWKAAREGRNKNFANEIKKDMGIYEYIYQLPHWVAMKFKEFAGITNVEWDRLDKMNSDRVELMMEGDTKVDNIFLSTKDVTGIENLIVDSDAENIFYEGPALQNRAIELLGRELTQEEISAYNSWKGAFDKAKKYIVTKSKIILFLRMGTNENSKLAMQVGSGAIALESVKLESKEDQKEFNMFLKEYTENLQKIAAIEEKLDGLNFYMPRIREHGDYVVRVYAKDPGGNDIAIFADRRESDIQAEKLRLQLLSDPAYKDLRILKTKENVTPEFLFEGINQSKIEAFLERSIDRAQRKEGLTSEEAQTVLDNIYNTVENEILARGFRETYLKRVRLPGGAPIAGYQTENLKSVFMGYMSGLAGSMNKLEATFSFHEAMKEIDKVKQPNLFEYAHRYITDQLRNSDKVTRMVNRAKSIPYAWYLMANARMVAAQLFQNYITGAAILSRYRSENKVGAGATRRISKAMFDVATGNMTENEKGILNRAHLEGETAANMVNEMKGRVEGGWARKVQGVMDVLSIPFSGMEKLNRQTAILAAYRLGREQHLNAQVSYDRAKQFVRDAHYAYGKSNMPQLLRDGTTFSQFAGGAYTFRSFTHNYILSMMHYSRTAEGRLAIDVVGRSLAFVVLLGGLAAVPFLDDLLDALERLTGTNYRSQIRASLKGLGGEILGRVGMSGIPTIIGIDLSGTVKVTPSIPFIGQGSSGGVWGVWGGLAEKGTKGVKYALEGDFARSLESALPTGLESPMKAIRESVEGVRGATNRPVVDESGQPVKLTTGEAISQGLAMRPARVAELSKERRVEANIEQYFMEKRKDIYSHVRVAKTADDWAKIMKNVQTFNVKAMSYKGAISPITMDSMRQSMKISMKYPKYAASLGETEEEE